MPFISFVSVRSIRPPRTLTSPSDLSFVFLDLMAIVRKQITYCGNFAQSRYAVYKFCIRSLNQAAENAYFTLRSEFRLPRSHGYCPKTNNVLREFRPIPVCRL